MAIADTVWERLARFNAPHRGRDGVPYLDGAAAVLRGLALVCVAAIVAVSALARMLMPVVLWLGRNLLWLLGELGIFVCHGASALAGGCGISIFLLVASAWAGDCICW
jgi:hypothetical protein